MIHNFHIISVIESKKIRIHLPKSCVEGGQILNVKASEIENVEKIGNHRCGSWRDVGPVGRPASLRVIKTLAIGICSIW